MAVKRFCLVVLLIIFAQQMIAATSTVTDVRVAKHNGETQLILGLTAPFQYKLFTLKYPERIVVDLPNSQLARNFSKTNFSGTPIKTLRTAKKDNRTLRFVFDLRQAVTSRTIKLNKDKNYNYRLVINLKPKAKKAVKVTTNKKTTPVKPRKPLPVVTVRVPKKLRNVIVVIDPGHGGKDPGATGLRGTHEKNVVLGISRNLQRLINQQHGMRAVMTRRADYYISLRRRLQIARKDKGDIFIAIHADAFKNRQSHGASVYALSPRGATSEAARWLAERENYSELGGVDLSDKSYVLRSVLLDLSQTATIGSSLQLGTAVLGNLGRITRLHNKKVEQARFVVLKSPDIPSILIETGFISNPREELNLRSSRFQRKVAQAILSGVKRYFWMNPPPGTLLAAERRARTYKVVRGDSLSRIANRHHVPLRELKQLNRLSNNNVRIGQVLRIPAKRGA